MDFAFCVREETLVLLWVTESFLLEVLWLRFRLVISHELIFMCGVSCGSKCFCVVCGIKLLKPHL